MILASARAALPSRLLWSVQPGVQRIVPKAPGGRAVTKKLGATRGRPAGSGPPFGKPGERISLIDTLRRAAPWQTMRRRERLQNGSAFRVYVEKDDLRVRRHQGRAQSTTIFSVDASGSTALQRLGEAKGAVELVLGDCYIRRDRVALIAFRGRGAEIVLHPTRSLVRAKRVLAGLAGGGGTPLALGITAAAQLAIRMRRAGGVPIIVLLTDGGANVASDGHSGRERAQADSIEAARSVRRSGLSSLLIDTSPRGQPRAELVAREMGALYLALPQADAHQISSSVRSIVRQ
jgi:magnesium chelatase subunit D